MNVLIKVKSTQSVILRANTLLLSKIADLCSYQKVSDKAKKYSKACQSGNWDGRVSLVDKYTGVIPTGLVPKVVRWLKEEGHTVEIEKDLPVTFPSNKFKSIESLKILRDYQKDAIDLMIKRKRGIVQLPTGSGKTIIAIGAVAELKRNTIFFAHTKELINQTKEKFKKFFPDIKIGTIGGGIIDPGPITIASIQTVSSWLIPPKKCNDSKLEEWNALNEKAIKFLSKFPVAIFDECHHLAAETFYTCAQHCTNAEYLYALSATPFRDDNADLLIEAGSGSTIFAMSLSDVISLGYLLKAQINIYDYNPLPPMILSDTYAEQYKICITMNEDRNNRICEIVKKELKQNHSTLILCREIDHLNILQETLTAQGIECTIIYSKTKNRLEILDKFKNGEIKVLIGSTIFDEGVDIPCVDSIILAGAGRSRVKTYQRIGRALRTFEGKDMAIIHDFKDDTRPFSYHYRDRLKIYDSEKYFEVLKHFKARTRNVIHKNSLIKDKLEYFEEE